VETSLTFDQALAALLGLIGEYVDVMIGSAVQPHSYPFATFSGTLQGGREMRRRRSPSSECFYFAVGEDLASGFWLERDRFGGARDSSLFDGPTLFQGEIRISVWRNHIGSSEIEFDIENEDEE